MSLTDGQAGLSLQISAPKPANTRLSGDVRAAFEDIYNTNKNPAKHERQAIAERHNVTLTKVTNWFIHRRGKDKVKEKEQLANQPAGPPPPSPAEAADKESILLYPWSKAILSNLKQLFDGAPEADDETADIWAGALGISRVDMIRWLRWRRLPSTESRYSGREPSVPRKRASSPPRYIHTQIQPALNHAPVENRRSHLPTPSSASPSPRNQNLYLKHEPPLSPVSATSRPLSVYSPVGTSLPGNFAAHEVGGPTSPIQPLITPSQQLSPHPSSVPPASTVPQATPLLSHPSEPPPKPSLREFMRKQFPTREAFDQAASFPMISNFDKTLEVFNQMGKDATRAMERLSKMPGANMA